MPDSFVLDAHVFALRSFAIRLASSFVIIISGALPFAAALAGPLTLEQAWAHAEHVNPDLRAAEAGLAAAQGQLNDTRGMLWNNPQIASDLARGQAAQVGVPSEAFAQWHIGLSQTFELACGWRIRISRRHRRPKQASTMPSPSKVIERGFGRGRSSGTLRWR